MSRKLWAITLAIWLVLTGLFTITNFRIEGATLIMGCLAITAGILLVFDK